MATSQAVQFKMAMLLATTMFTENSGTSQAEWLSSQKDMLVAGQRRKGRSRAIPNPTTHVQIHSNRGQIFRRRGQLFQSK
ncbi:MAG: hypothetical protein Edafosvirus11_1 [Edafosvirus sp.]|uniref:Uncharacterized protein n=1 Tax=Edafosvirus sp. TaxID=2487765 RepID=A0A3G4ZTY0_9VIRU|nr:MAG: hypothetical protein Edafosvirus11_1 [Edafosvirus sp.]